VQVGVDPVHGIGCGGGHARWAASHIMNRRAAREDARV
jgi:hypothetical protein